MVKPTTTKKVNLENATKGRQVLYELFAPRVLWIFLLVVVVGSLFSGAYAMTIDEIGMLILNRVGLGNGAINSGMDYLLFDIRLPRILMGVVIGAGLAVSGAAIQGLFRNPLADPALIGVTSGAMTFAVAGILFFNALSVWVGQAAITICSFAGSLLCTLLVYRLATSNGRTSVATMLLAGIAITALGGALTGLMTYFSTEEELRDITFWTLGSLSGATWEHLMIIAPIVGIALLVLHRYSQSLDLMLLGEHEAAYMGVNVQRAKWIIIICVAIIVGACVSFSGVIAFVALVVPHLVRLVRGPRHSVLLLSGGMLGAILLVGADMIARTIIAPAELPIGILTALLGAPFFIGLLVKSKQQLW